MKRIPHISRATTAIYLRSFIFGVEDSLVSTLGLLSGVAIAAVPQKTIFLSGLVLIAVEAFSMAVGTYLSQESADEFVDGKEASVRKPLIASTIMFFSYGVTGLIPLGPYLFLAVRPAFESSIILTLIALFCLGAASGRLAKQNLWYTGFRMLIIGGLAAGLGIVVGSLVNAY